MRRYYFIESMDGGVITYDPRATDGTSALLVQPISDRRIAGQLWHVRYAGQPPYFVIQSCIRGERIRFPDASGSGVKSSLWTFVPTGDDYYYIQSAASGDMLSAGSTLYTYPQQWWSSQFWRLRRA